MTASVSTDVILPRAKSGLFAKLAWFGSLIVAAKACSDAVENNRRPDARHLRALDIDTHAFDHLPTR
jgi:hypothetical protein